MNAAVIASVHVAVIACRQSRTTEQNRAPQRIYPTLPGSGCRVPDTARTASRDWSMPLGQGEVISLECGCFRSETCRGDPGENGDYAAQACRL